MATREGGSGAAGFEGRTFGSYRIGPAIASGGMATVFMARKRGPGRFAQTAALKIIHPHLARNRELVEMFMDEARLASCVNHPNVCRVLDFGETQGTFFLAMEYVRGDTWARVLEALRDSREGRAHLPALSAHVLAQACEGLHAIHEAVDAEGRPLRIVHRDVSPQNLLIGYDGSVRLLDFGIASAEGRAHTSGSDVVRGRYPYMAPEQMRGLEVDRRADIWSLGVVLREAISGQNPFARDTQIATMLAVTQDPLPAWPGRVPLVLREIAERALQRESEQRFADARELGNALTHYLTTQNEPALNAELARFMRELFSAEISQTHTALKQLAGDDGTDVFSSTFPAQPSVALDTGSCLSEAARKQPPSRRSGRPAWLRGRAPFWAAASALFVGSLLGSWYLAGGQRAPRALSARPRPEVVQLRPGDMQAPPAAVGASVAATPAQAVAVGSVTAAPAPPAQPSSAAAPAPSAREERERAASRQEQTASTASTDSASQRESGESTHERATPVSELATVVVGTSQGWAEVFADGHRLGTTPLRTELPLGTHALEVRPFGTGAPRRLSMDVKPGEVNKLRLEL